MISGRAAAVLALAALAAAGCDAGGSGPHSVTGAHSIGVQSTPAHPVPAVPVSRYLSVVQYYGVHNDQSGTLGQRRFTVTDPAAIAKLAALIDALPVAPKQWIHPCISGMAPAYQLDFQDTKDAGAAMSVAIDCFGVVVSVGGHQEPMLSDSATSVDVMAFLSQVQTLMAPYARSSSG
jgi:hypothetical protein